MSRSRSEYLLTSLSVASPIPSSTHRWTVRAVDVTDREQLATVILDAYRGTIDDEGEDHEAALAAVDDWLSRLESPHSVVLEQDARIVAVSFVVNVAGREYIDPVAVVRGASSRASAGLPLLPRFAPCIRSECARSAR